VRRGRRQCGRGQRCKHVLGRNRHARIDQHRGQCRQRERHRENLADAAHHARARIETDRHIRASRARGGVEPLVIEGKSVRLRQQPQRRRRI
jgi:hypothetical protein